MKKVSELIRVLQVGLHDKLGGVETCIMNYYRNIDRNKIQFDFASSYGEFYFRDEIKGLGGIVYDLPFEKKHPIKYLAELTDIMKKYQIVHINMLSAANILPIIAAKKAGVKHIIIHSHNSNTPSGAIRKALDKVNRKYLAKNGTDFWACSRLAGEWLFGDEVCKSAKFKIINNAIDRKKFEFDENNRKNIRQKYGISDDKILLGCVGRFEEQKNQQFIVGVLKRLPEKYKIMFIGEGTQKEHVCNMVSELSLQDRAIFLPNQLDIWRFYSAFDVFVLPSLFEGLELVAVEAQANGLTCILSDQTPHEVKFNNNVFFEKLSEGDWRKTIENSSIKRVNHFDDKYDIRKNVIALVDYYQNMYGE